MSHNPLAFVPTAKAPRGKGPRTKRKKRILAERRERERVEVLGLRPLRILHDPESETVLAENWQQ